jgi:hypothetical protein
LEALKGKMVISGDSGEFLETFGVVGGSWHKRRALAKSGKFFGDFCGILEGLKWFRT